jgi:hypothetical protein
MHVLHCKGWKRRLVFFAFNPRDRDRDCVFGGWDRDRVFGSWGFVFGIRGFVFGSRGFVFGSRGFVFGSRGGDCILSFSDRDAISGPIESSNSCRSHDHFNRMWSLFS